MKALLISCVIFSAGFAVYCNTIETAILCVACGIYFELVSKKEK